MENWQVSLIAIGVGIITFLLGSLFTQRNPLGLAQTVESQQRIISNMQKEIQALQSVIKPRRIEITTVIFVDDDVHVESQEVKVLEPHAEERVTRPRSRNKKSTGNGFGGFKL